MWVCIEVVVLDSRRFAPGSHIVLRGCGQRMLGRLQALSRVDSLSQTTAYARAPISCKGTAIARGTPLLLPNDQTLSLCLQHPCSDTDEKFASVSITLDVHAFLQGVVCAYDAVSGTHAVFYATRLRANQGPAQHRRVCPLVRAEACARVCLARDIFVCTDVSRCVCVDAAEADFCRHLMCLSLSPTGAASESECGAACEDGSPRSLNQTSSSSDSGGLVPVTTVHATNQA